MHTDWIDVQISMRFSRFRVTVPPPLFDAVSRHKDATRPLSPHQSQLIRCHIYLIPAHTFSFAPNTILATFLAQLLIFRPHSEQRSSSCILPKFPNYQQPCLARGEIIQLDRAPLLWDKIKPVWTIMNLKQAWNYVFYQNSRSKASGTGDLVSRGSDFQHFHLFPPRHSSLLPPAHIQPSLSIDRSDLQRIIFRSHHLAIMKAFISKMYWEHARKN